MIEQIRNGEVARSPWFIVLVTLLQGAGLAAIIGFTIWITRLDGKVNRIELILAEHRGGPPHKGVTEQLVRQATLLQIILDRIERMEKSLREGK